MHGGEGDHVCTVRNGYNGVCMYVYFVIYIL